MAHRLVGALADVDDRQAGVDEPDVVDDLDARPVGTAVQEGVPHRREPLRRRALAEREHAASRFRTFPRITDHAGGSRKGWQAGEAILAGCVGASTI